MLKLSKTTLLLLQTYLLLTALLYVFTGEQPLYGFLDELLLVALLALAFPIAIRGMHLQTLTLLTAVVLTSSIGILGAVANPDLKGFPALRGAIEGVAIDAKFPLFMIASYFLLRNSEIDFVERLCRAIVLFGILHGALSVLDIIRGVDLHGRQLENRVGLTIAHGIFDHKFKSAFTNVLFFAAAMHLRWRSTALFAFSLCILALSVKEMVAVATILTMSVSAVRFAAFRLIAATIFLFSIALLAVTDNPVKSAIADRLTLFATTKSAPETTVRTELYRSAPRIAWKYFPLGSGAGSFGSSPSRDVYYSPLYETYGISLLHGGGPGGVFLIDTFWPKVLAEYGFIGFVLFCYPLLLVARTKSAEAFPKYMFWAMLVISVGTPVFNYSDGAIFGGIAMGSILATGRKRHTALDDRTQPDREVQPYVDSNLSERKEIE